VYGREAGLRVSDLMELKPHHFIGDEKIQIRSQKTGGLLSIPLNNYSRTTLQKHPAGLPKMSPQKYNDYLKEMSVEAGLNRIVEQHKVFGSRTESNSIPLHEAISSHAGRRTFITQCLERGMPPHTVMSITDHKDLRTMYKYVGYLENEKSQAMSLAWDN
jgi:integrase